MLTRCGCIWPIPRVSPCRSERFLGRVLWGLRPLDLKTLPARLLPAACRLPLAAAALLKTERCGRGCGGPPLCAASGRAREESRAGRDQASRLGRWEGGCGCRIRRIASLWCGTAGCPRRSSRPDHTRTADQTTLRSRAERGWGEGACVPEGGGWGGGRRGDDSSPIGPSAPPAARPQAAGDSATQ
eukprot:COSAG04_NODE_3484_length_2779_cov_18.460448_5_plen_185_part_01